MTTPIETAFADLCAKHDLRRIGIDLGHCDSGPYFHCTVHWDGYSRRGYNCISENGSTASEAISLTLAAMIADRMQPQPEVPTLTIAEAA